MSNKVYIRKVYIFIEKLVIGAALTNILGKFSCVQKHNSEYMNAVWHYGFKIIDKTSVSWNS